MKSNLLCITAILLLVCFMGGCTTTLSYEEIIQKAETINISDGIDRDEAIVLAQYYLIDNELDGKHSVYRVGDVNKHEKYWMVSFISGVARGAESTSRQYGFVKPISLKIDLLTGRVSE